MKMGFTVYLIASVALGSSIAAAADVRQGERMARRWCSPCHVVASDQTQPTSEAPPFSTIANNKNFDANQLAFFLLDPHPKMPDMGLSRREANDLAAYIASLKNER